MAQVGSANIRITADDSQAGRVLGRFEGRIRRVGRVVRTVADTGEYFDKTARGMRGLTEEAQKMQREMNEGYAKQRQAMTQNRSEMVKQKYEMYKLAQAGADYNGTQDEFMAKIEEVGIARKKATEEQMRNDKMGLASFYNTVGSMLARSTQSSKIAANMTAMGGAFNKVNLPLLGISNRLEEVAKRGTPAALALKQLGSGANLKDLNDRMRLIAGGVMRFQSVLLVTTIAAGLFYKTLHEGAKKASKEYAGAWSGMIQSIQKIFEPLILMFAQLMTPVYKAIKFVADLVVEFQKANPVLTKVIAAFAVLVPLITLLATPLAVGIGLWSGISAAMASAAPLLTPLITGFASILGTVVLVAAGLVALGAAFVLLYKKSSEFRAFVGVLRKGIEVAFAAIYNAVDKAIRRIKDVALAFAAWEGFVPLILGLATAFGTYYTILGLVWARKKALIVVTKAYMALQKLGTAIQVAYTASMIAFNAAGGGMKGVLAVLRAGMIKLNVAMVANPIGLVIALLAGLVVGLVVAYKNSETFRKIVDKAFSSIKKTAKAVFDWFTVELPKLGSRFKNWADKAYADTVGAMRDMRDRVIKFFKDLIAGADNLYNKTIQSIRNMKNGIVNGFKSAWKIAKDIAFKATKAIVQFIVDVVKMYVFIFKNWKPLMKEGVKALYDIAKDSFKRMGQYIIDTFNKMVKWTRDLPSRMTKAFKSTWSYLQKAYRDLAIYLYLQLSKFGDKAVKFFKGLPSRVSKAFRSTWNFIRKSFTDLTGYLSDKLSAFMKKTVDWFKKLPARIGSAFRSTYQRVKDAFNALWKSVTDKVSRTFKTIVDWAKGLPKRIGSAFRSTVGSATSAIKSFADSIASKMSKTYKGIVDGAKALPKKIGDGIRNMAGKATSGVRSMGNSLLSGMGKAVNGLVGGINTILSKLEIKDRIPKWKVPKYKHGTDGHQGGLAILGDGGGRELFRTPDGTTALSPAKDTMYNLPRGTTVLSAEKTKKLMGKVPRYAKGVGDFFGDSMDWAKAKYNGAKSKATDVKNFFKKSVKDIWDYASNPSKLVSLLVEKLGLKMPSGSGVGKIASGGMNMLIREAKNFIKDKFDMFAGDGEGGVNVFKGLTKTQGFGKAGGANGYFHHDGVDYAGKLGTFIRSVTDGKVSFAGGAFQGHGGGFGNLVKVKQGIYEHFYGHLQKVLATNGQAVKAGQTLLGKLGSTGNSTGAHVHYEVRKNGTPVDPMPFLTGKKQGGNVDSWIRKAMSIAGLKGANWFTGLKTIAMGESTGDPNKVNNWDSNARAGIPSKGLMQVIPPTFSQYMKKGYGNIMNPIDNILASIGYIKGRYGSISNVPGVVARRLGKPYVGYEQGGFIKQQQVAMLGEGNKREVVVPLQNKRYMQPFAKGISDNLDEMGGRGVEFNQTNVFNATGIMSPAESAKAVKKQSKIASKQWG